jgi:cobyrinic acid a,c-diamide synthase
MVVRTPRLVVAGLSGDSGKTIVSLSLITGLRERGLTVAPFKKGPDYIDPAWLAWAADATCRNLDTFLIDEPVVVQTFSRHAAASDIAVVEGNRGLFDGKDVSGSHSTAGLARLLQAPVVLVVNATKTTRTIAALVHGCMTFESGVNIAGVVLNRVAGPRHERVVSQAIETTCGIPVLGVIPRIKQEHSLIPGRHLGLVPPTEMAEQSAIKQRMIDIATNHLDLERIRSIADEAPGLEPAAPRERVTVAEPVKVGVFRDSVFTFYYPENLEALERAGAELVPISSLADPALPPIDALYIGGGFPETHAERLVANRALMSSVRKAADEGLPIYAECGGLIYLSRSVTWQEEQFEMAGVLAVDLIMTQRPAGHGYVKAEVDSDNPFFEKGTQIKGHEFHYSTPIDEVSSPTCLAIKTGTGLAHERDGLVVGSVFAAYSHLHADSVPTWADAVVSRAREHRSAVSRGKANQSRGDNETDESDLDSKQVYVY